MSRRRARRAREPVPRGLVQKVKLSVAERDQLSDRAAELGISMPRLLVESALSGDRQLPTERRQEIATLLRCGGCWRRSPTTSISWRRWRTPAVRWLRVSGLTGRWVMSTNSSRRSARLRVSDDRFESLGAARIRRSDGSVQGLLARAGRLRSSGREVRSRTPQNVVASRRGCWRVVRAPLSRTKHHAKPLQTTTRLSPDSERASRQKYLQIALIRPDSHSCRSRRRSPVRVRLGYWLEPKAPGPSKGQRCSGVDQGA